MRLLLAAALALSLFLSACSGPSAEEAWETYQATKAAAAKASDAFFEARRIMEAAELKESNAYRWRNQSREDFQAWKAANAELEAAEAAYSAAIKASTAASDARSKAKEAWHEAEE